MHAFGFSLAAKRQHRLIQVEGPKIEVAHLGEAGRLFHPRSVQQLGFSTLWLADNIGHAVKMGSADLGPGLMETSDL